MADLFAYINWRGDIPFSQVPPTPVDNLLFSTLVYIGFDGLVPEDTQTSVPLYAAAEAFFALPDQQDRIRVRSDLRLLRAMADAPRFRNIRLTFYRSRLIPEEETQFAAMAFLLPDGSAYLAFRGTDMTLVGWKEDFNMSFQDYVPAQLEAVTYTREFAAQCPMVFRMGGHSKGGNLAVFAAAMCGEDIQKRIIAVFSNDGPGFTDYLMGAEGYLAMVPRIHTFIPESSIIGMLLEHEEEYRVIRSSHVSLLQHEPYSWEVMGGDFLYAEEISSETKFMDTAIKSWIKDMTLEERSNFVDAIYDLLSASGAQKVTELIQPKNVWSFFKTLNADENIRNLLAGELADFLRAAAASLPGGPA